MNLDSGGSVGLVVVVGLAVVVRLVVDLVVLVILK